MLCELCGKSDARLQIIVEGSKLYACQKCAGLGKVVGQVKSIVKVEKKLVVKEELPSETLTSDYGPKIKSAREKLGKTQEELGQLIGEKVSVVQKIETNKFEPSIELTKKMERVLKIRLIEKSDAVMIDIQKARHEESFTLGDFVSVKKKNV